MIAAPSMRIQPLLTTASCPRIQRTGRSVDCSNLRLNGQPFVQSRGKFLQSKTIRIAGFQKGRENKFATGNCLQKILLPRKGNDYSYL